MGANINEIISLMAGEKMGTPNTWVNMASLTQNGCHNYKITGATSCDSDLNPVTLYLDIPAFDPVTYKRVIKERETGRMQNRRNWWSIEPVLTFAIAMDEAARNRLEIIAEHVTRKFTLLTGAGAGTEVTISWMDIQANPDDTWLRVEVKMTFEDSLIINKLCCGSFYDDGPEPECDGEGETGDPNDDATCEGLTVGITLGAGPVLTATPAGGTATGTEIFTWYLDGSPFGSGASIMPTLSGVYRVDYQIGNCFATAEFTYSAPCEDFAVTIQTIILPDGSTLLIAQPTMIADIQWQIFNDPDWDDVPGETGIAFQPEEDGTYRAKATTTGECEALSDGVAVEMVTDCSDLFDIEIENTGGNLNGSVNNYEGEGTPSYQWWFDDGTGAVNTGNTGTTIPVGDPGLYIWVVTIDGCVRTKHYFVNCEMTVNPCGDPCGFPYQSFGPGVTGVEFSVTNFTLLDPALYTEDQINATFQSFKNGVLLRYVAPATLAALAGSDPTARTLWSIDYATQRAILHTDWALKATEVLMTIRIR